MSVVSNLKRPGDRPRAAYEQMWAQDVAAMFGYHAGASAAVSSALTVRPGCRPWQAAVRWSARPRLRRPREVFATGLGERRRGQRQR